MISLPLPPATQAMTCCHTSWQDQWIGCLFIIFFWEVDSLEDYQKVVLVPSPDKTQLCTSCGGSIPTEVQQLTIHPSAQTAARLQPPPPTRYIAIPLWTGSHEDMLCLMLCISWCLSVTYLTVTGMYITPYTW